MHNWERSREISWNTRKTGKSGGFVHLEVFVSILDTWHDAKQVFARVVNQLTGDYAQLFCCEEKGTMLLTSRLLLVGCVPNVRTMI
jgi:hypothetical protein